MTNLTDSKRPYHEVAQSLRQMIIEMDYAPDDRLPTEREIAEKFGVSRALIREALIVLELENIIEVRKSSGIYLVRQPGICSGDTLINVAGPFELLQARQLLESNIAEFAALQVTRADIDNMRSALEKEKNDLISGESESGDREFHLAIARATQNSALVEVLKQFWDARENNPMWVKLHSRITNTDYRQAWLNDHQAILAAMIKKDPAAAKQTMWQHLENVKQSLLELSDIDAPDFDGFLFESYPVGISK
ncbi:MAG: FCD domain-containing protein [Enterobacteriaceae bacterium]|jgi:GntR family uxuAB operon transcriptional repressor|nr:FCD domain-containing protein [Enterobacteriaceae bacterium]